MINEKRTDFVHSIDCLPQIVLILRRIHRKQKTYPKRNEYNIG